MDSILVVAENEINLQSMLVKAQRFSPKLIRVIFFEGDTLDSSRVKTIMSDVINGCENELVICSDTNLNSKTDTLTQMVSEMNPTMVVIHRPQIGQEENDFSLIKTVLKSQSKANVFLCGDNRWKSKIKVLATLDISDQSDSQVLLNTKVLNMGIAFSNNIQAELILLSVLPISRISKELDIVEPCEIMAAKGEDATRRLAEMMADKTVVAGFSTQVSAGIPADEIASASQKLKTQLVILGNVARTGIKGFIVGNTAEKILNKLAVDALIVKQNS